MLVLFYLCTILIVQLQPALALPQASSLLEQQLEQGDILLAADKLPEALSSYRQAVKTYPTSSAAHERLAKALSLAGDLPAAQQEAQRAIQLDPLNAAAHSNLGWLLGIQKNYHQAIAEERIAIHLDPSIASSHLTLALALASIGDYDGALKANRKALELEPDNLKAYINLAATLGRKGDYSQAIDVYKQALQLNPNSVAAHLGLGAALGKTGQIQAQIAMFRRAVQLSPGNDNAHGKLGWALYQTGDWDGAVREGWITNWLRLSKSGPDYLRNVIGLWGGIFLLFGAIFAAIFFSCHFTPLNGEIVDKSYFLIFHKEKPGRFIITNKRLVFIPEAFSAWFGSQPVSINKDQIADIEPSTAGKAGGIQIALKDGTTYGFTMPPLVAKPLLVNLSKTINEAFSDDQA